MRLAHIVNRDGYADLIVARFEREVLWVRQTESFYKTNEKQSKVLNDYHGFMTSFDTMLASAQADPSETVNVWMRIIETPCVEVPNAFMPPEWLRNGRQSYLRTRREWFLDDEAAAAFDPKTAEEGVDYGLTFIEPKTIEVLGWSKHYSDAMNAHARKNLESYRP